jgi:hypothetical protein
MHIIMPILLLLSFPLLGFIFYDLIKRTHRTRLLVLSAIALVFAGLLTWYLIPTKYELPDSGDLSIHIVFPIAHKQIEISDPEQKEELLRLVEELRAEREFLSSNRGKSFDGREYVYMSISGYDYEAGKKVDINLNMTLNEGGFSFGYGSCFDDNHANIKNPQRLIAYVRSLINAS